MKILIDARLFSKGEASGIEEYARNLLESIFAIDQTNEYQLFYNGFRKTPLNTQLAINNYKNVKVIDWGIPNKILDFGGRFFDWPKIDRFIKSDICFSPHFNILRFKNIPRIITFHDLSFVHHPYFFSWKQRFWHWLQSVQKQAREADNIIAVSEFTKNDLIETLGVKPEKIFVIYSGISTEFKQLDKSSATPNSAPYILYLGTLEPRKNVIALIMAFNRLKTLPMFSDFKLVLAGRAGWLYQDILKEADSSPYSKDIIIKGKIDRNERLKLYNFARVFVYPSFFEGFGFPPLEAQACGCPVISGYRASLVEVMKDSALFVDPWKIDDLVEKIKTAVTDGALRSRLIQAGLENVKRFSWSEAARKTSDLFYSLT